MDADKAYGEKDWKAIVQECYKLYWTKPRGNFQENSSFTAIYHPSRKSIQVRRTRHVRYCRGGKDELISDVLLWISSHGQTSIWWPAITYVQQLCSDTGCSMGDQPGAMDDRDEWRDRVRESRTRSMLWWGGWLYIYIYIYKNYRNFLTHQSVCMYIYMCVCVSVCMCVCARIYIWTLHFC